MSISKKLEGGFTLVELMITVVIVGVLASLATPAMQHLILTERVRSATTDLQTALYFARSEAIKRATNVDVVPCKQGVLSCTCGQSGFPACNSSGNDWTNGWLVQLGTATLRSQDALNDQLSAMPGATFSYRSDGRVTATPATMILRTGNAEVTARCLSIDLSGRPNVVQDTDGIPSNGCN